MATGTPLYQKHFRNNYNYNVQPFSISFFHAWQSRIEIEYYSVVHFKRISKFDVL